MVEAGISKLLSMIKRIASANWKKVPWKTRKENKHSEVDINEGIAGFPAESACLLILVYPSPQVKRPRRLGGIDVILWFVLAWYSKVPPDFAERHVFESRKSFWESSRV